MASKRHKEGFILLQNPLIMRFIIAEFSLNLQ